MKKQLTWLSVEESLPEVGSEIFLQRFYNNGNVVIAGATVKNKERDDFLELERKALEEWINWKEKSPKDCPYGPDHNYRFAKVGEKAGYRRREVEAGTIIYTTYFGVEGGGKRDCIYAYPWENLLLHFDDGDECFLEDGDLWAYKKIE